MEGNYWLLGLAFCLSLVLTPFIGKMALRCGAVDKPGGRKIHKAPLPCWGGLSIFLGFALPLLLLSLTRHFTGSEAAISRELLGLLAGGLVILLVGLFDDWRGLSPWLKLAGQAAAAGVVVAGGITVDFITNPLGGMIYLGIWSIPVTITWIVAITNALNLVDGLDGLAAGIAAIAAGTVAVVAWGQGQQLVAFCAFLLMASILGFLPFNFHPAKIFMGDTGSLFLGFTLASLAMLGLTKAATALALVLPVLVLGIPIFDMSFAIIRRIILRKHIFEADRDHLHHRLLDLGLSHRQTVLINYAVSLILGVSAILLTYLTTSQGIIMLLLLILIIFFGAGRFHLFAVSRTKKSARSLSCRGSAVGTEKTH